MENDYIRLVVDPASRGSCVAGDQYMRTPRAVAEAERFRDAVRRGIAERLPPRQEGDAPSS